MFRFSERRWGLGRFATASAKQTERRSVRNVRRVESALVRPSRASSRGPARLYETGLRVRPPPSLLRGLQAPPGSLSPLGGAAFFELFEHGRVCVNALTCGAHKIQVSGGQVSEKRTAQTAIADT